MLMSILSRTLAGGAGHRPPTLIAVGGLCCNTRPLRGVDIPTLAFGRLLVPPRCRRSAPARVLQIFCVGPGGYGWRGAVGMHHGCCGPSVSARMPALTPRI